MQLRNDGHISSNGYTALRFAVRSTQDAQPLAVYLRDSDFNNLTRPLSLANYGGYPVASGWKVYTIPLADLKATNVSLGSIVIHTWTGSAQPAVYIDDIQLVSLP